MEQNEIMQLMKLLYTGTPEQKAEARKRLKEFIEARRKKINT